MGSEGFELSLYQGSVTLDNYRNFDYRIKYALKNAIKKQIGPMRKEKIEIDKTYYLPSVYMVNENMISCNLII